MTNGQIRRHGFAVLAAVLASDDDGLHDLMSGLDRDELDFLVTGLYAMTAGFMVSVIKGYGHPDPKAEALRIVRQWALEAADEDTDQGNERGDGE